MNIFCPGRSKTLGYERLRSPICEQPEDTMILMDGRTCECGVTFRARYVAPSGSRGYVAAPSSIACPSCAKRHEFAVGVMAVTDRFSSEAKPRPLPFRRVQSRYF